MSMTPNQAKRLGRLIANARSKQGVSTRVLAAQTGLSLAWIGELEAGVYLDPAPERLARLAEALEVEPTRIDALTKGALQSGLPEPSVYFRSKMAMTPDETEKVMRYIERMRRAAGAKP